MPVFFLYSRMLYWVDIENNKIEMSFMDGSNITSISGVDFAEPTGKQIHPLLAQNKFIQI